MSTLSVRLPNSLHNAARELAKEEEVSINQLIASALSEKLAAFKTVSYLQDRANKGSVEEFRRIMAKVPNVEPEPYDKL